MEVEYDDNGNYKLKIILIGNSGVGKTNLINIMQDKDFNESEATTPTCSFIIKEMVVEDLNFNVYLWDTIGQEKLKSQTKIFFKNSKIVILVYSIAVKDSFTELQNWHQQVKESLGDNIVLGVLGNKKDLFMQEQVSEEEAKAYAESIGAEWGLTSAKTERQSFVTYIEKLIQIYIKKANIKTKKDEIVREKSVKLDSKDTNTKTLKKKKAC